MLEEHLQTTIALAQRNPWIGIVFAILMVALFYLKPKEMFKLAVFGLFIAVVFYIITLLIGTVGSGSGQKDRMINKSRDSLGE